MKITAEERLIEKRIEEIYERANEELTEKADKYFEAFAQKDAAKRKLVQQGKMTEEAYRKWRESQLMAGARWQTLVRESSDVLVSAYSVATDYVNGKIPKIYANGYNYVAKGINAELGTTFSLVDAHTVKRLATKVENLLPYKIVDGVKVERWDKQKINAEVLQGIIQGDSMQEISRRFQNVSEMSRASAMRNARTTVTSAENKGRMDMLEDAADDGVVTKKIWIAVMDNDTRDAHKFDLNGQEADIDEPFHSRLGEIMYPADPHADPANVYNCRCTLGYRVVGFKKR